MKYRTYLSVNGVRVKLYEGASMDKAIAFRDMAGVILSTYGLSGVLSLVNVTAWTKGQEEPLSDKEYFKGRCVTTGVVIAEQQDNTQNLI